MQNLKNLLRHKLHNLLYNLKTKGNIKSESFQKWSVTSVDNHISKFVRQIQEEDDRKRIPGNIVLLDDLTYKPQEK